MSDMAWAAGQLDGDLWQIYDAMSGTLVGLGLELLSHIDNLILHKLSTNELEVLRGGLDDPSGEVVGEEM